MGYREKIYPTKPLRNDDRFNPREILETTFEIAIYGYVYSDLFYTHTIKPFLASKVNPIVTKYLKF